ncbi:MAG: chromosome segregation protein SMC, partial [Methylococcaceae bacterium]|nr:chromosome segregation protein SMC [Methylococcaceae bacterium]
AQYDSIAIKRQVSRDGQSLFMLNGSRCRRKDITDLFLGTGLGSRSYAIIEQGTISRMVEAKPEDLRIHIEEAAGISKYKERRSETETRMKHTRENLERLEDLREEVEKQLKHLQKQAEKAEKYTELKKQERQYKLELLAMRWNTYHQAALQLETKLQAVAAEHNRLFVAVRDLDHALESQRAAHKTQQQHLNTAQGDYYSVVAEVSGLEQAIKHHAASHQETSLDLSRSLSLADQLLSEIDSEGMALADIKENLLIAEDRFLDSETRLAEVLAQQQTGQQQQTDWQQQWEAYRTESARYKEQAEVHKVTVLQLENQSRQVQARIEKLQREQADLANSELQTDLETLDADIEIIGYQRDNHQAQLEQLQHQIREQRQHVKQLHDALHSRRSESHSIKGKITSLELLQQHAMGKDNKNLGTWLADRGLDKQARLAEFLDVAPGWDTAVEKVLGHYLQALCVTAIEPLLGHLSSLSDDTLSLFATQPHTDTTPKPNSLLSKVTAPWDLSALLAGIYCADDHASAYALAVQLAAHESVITPDGTWFGATWATISHHQDSKVGVLQREKELRLLKQRLTVLLAELDEFEEQLADTESALKDAESQRESIQQQDNKLGAELSVKSAEFSAYSARWENQQTRLGQIANDLAELHLEANEHAEAIAESQLLLASAETIMATQAQQRQHLEAEQQLLQAQHEHTARAVNEARAQVYSLKAEWDGLRNAETNSQKQLERLTQQHQHAVLRIDELEHKLAQHLAPLDDEKHQLAERLLDKERLEAELKKQRLHQDSLEQDISSLAEQHLHSQRALEKQKESLDALRFELQESKVRQQTVNEQLKDIEADAEQVLKNLPESAEELRWKAKVDDLTGQIERLGTINLTAIEEYKSQAERMNFLNEQQADLITALNLLDQAISKIDKESRLRFKETFDKINNGLQEKFPKLFGGGQAYLELTEQDLLESGVNIIARPPGKRNSSIHLLSGGEKALTAVALVFSIFELNPAPFCLLDEVDAPLDDANVGRFSKMVEEMSASVQFLYISHNKVTMEIAQQLAGVTMKEPGVSRMVAVDIEEAVSLAES